MTLSVIFFSENTSIGEVLVICRRWSGSDPKPPTRVVNLARNPATPIEALDTAARIERAGKTGSKDSHDFTVQWVGSDRIKRGDWSAVNFLSPFLSGGLSDAQRGKSSVCSKGVTTERNSETWPGRGSGYRDAYTHSDMPTQVGTPGALVSQDGRHAVDASGDRRLH